MLNYSRTLYIRTHPVDNANPGLTPNVDENRRYPTGFLLKNGIPPLINPGFRFIRGLHACFTQLFAISASQESHTDVVNHVRFHPDGKLLSGAEESWTPLQTLRRGGITRRLIVVN